MSVLRSSLAFNNLLKTQATFSAWPGHKQAAGRTWPMGSVWRPPLRPSAGPPTSPPNTGCWSPHRCLPQATSPPQMAPAAKRGAPAPRGPRPGCERVWGARSHCLHPCGQVHGLASPASAPLPASGTRAAHAPWAALSGPQRCEVPGRAPGPPGRDERASCCLAAVTLGKPCGFQPRSLICSRAHTSDQRGVAAPGAHLLPPSLWGEPRAGAPWSGGER